MEMFGKTLTFLFSFLLITTVFVITGTGSADSGDGDITATIDIKPDTLNLKSNGKDITAYIELEDGVDMDDINYTAIKLPTQPANGDIFSTDDYLPAYSHEIGDFDGDGVEEMKVKFDRQGVIEYIMDHLNYVDPDTNDFTLSIIGELYDGQTFIGNDDVRVIIAKNLKDANSEK